MSKKVFKITNTNTKEVIYTCNKTKFCDEKGLTLRLLYMTQRGQRKHHKGYILDKQSYVFIESPDGQHTLYGCDKLGYILPYNENEKVIKNRVAFNEDIKGNIKNELESTADTDKELIKAHRKIQRLTDTLRELRKVNRSTNREEITVDEFTENVYSILKDGLKLPNCNIKPHHTISNSDEVLLVQLTDLHIGKVVDLPHNKFNYDVATHRLDKLADEILDLSSRLNINKCTVAFTGDLTNLDSHFDNLLTNEDNRANNFVKAFEILNNFLSKLSMTLDVSCISVVGNESRIRSDLYQSNVDSIASNNFDTLLFKLLKKVVKNVNFIGDGDKLIDILDISSKKIALLHGDKLKNHNDDNINKLKMKIYNTFNVMVDYVIFGHIHSCLITNEYARSGSLVGADNYSFNGLNIANFKASQNIYIVSDRDIKPIMIELN